VGTVNKLAMNLAPGQSTIDQRIGNPKAKLVRAAGVVSQIADDRAHGALSLFEESILIGSPPKSSSARSAQSHDWDVRATEVIAEARKMPLGQRRSDALGEAGRLRIAAEMKRWLSTK
jgi:hypothetical protein